MDIQTTTIYIALYGAILSSIGIFWNIYRDFLDKPKIKVTTNIGFLDYGKKLSDTIINFEATNIGKRPAILSSAGIALENNENLIFIEGTNLPVKLEEGNSHNIIRNLKELKEDLKQHPQPKYVWFKDRTGKTYKSKKRKLKKLLKI